jgi:hypothetical protein
VYLYMYMYVYVYVVYVCVRRPGCCGCQVCLGAAHEAVHMYIKTCVCIYVLYDAVYMSYIKLHMSYIKLHTHICVYSLFVCVHVCIERTAHMSREIVFVY